MKTITYATFATLFLAAPALAHSGAHLHPHGFENLNMGLALIAAAGAAAFLLAGRK
ncbi:hypothetical protein WG622_00750 [Cognatishimia sp. D5M38]|uniref:Peptidase M23 n=2 Tax=Cognatishimia TaxID=2211635 RepID=A0A975I6V7_9RHOB|nr:peptidase M23 [Cognatishimia activa]QTN35320.1 peptidase M23 [Cognatishimia activa]